jgi:hypothetical protein
MKGILHCIDGNWVVRYSYIEREINGKRTIMDVFLHPDDINDIQNNIAEGVEVEFEILSETDEYDKNPVYAKLVSGLNNKTMYSLYDLTWDDVFNEIEISLKIELPIRLQNWFENKFYAPLKK